MCIFTPEVSPLYAAYRKALIFLTESFDKNIYSIEI